MKLRRQFQTEKSREIRRKASVSQEIQKYAIYPAKNTRKIREKYAKNTRPKGPKGQNTRKIREKYAKKYARPASGIFFPLLKQKNLEKRERTGRSGYYSERIFFIVV
jgi:hypothetical protein